MLFKIDRPIYLLLVVFVISAVQTAAVAEETSPIRVACLGDSITAGARVDAKSESYPAIAKAVAEQIRPQQKQPNIVLFRRGRHGLARHVGAVPYGSYPSR